MDDLNREEIDALAALVAAPPFSTLISPDGLRLYLMVGNLLLRIETVDEKTWDSMEQDEFDERIAKAIESWSKRRNARKN